MDDSHRDRGRAAKKRGSSSEEGESGPHSRAPDSETEREAKKKRISPGEEMELAQLARPEMTGVGGNFCPQSIFPDRLFHTGCLLLPGVQFSLDDQDESMTQTQAVEEEQDEFTPKSPISMPYIPDELKDPTAYPATLAAFEEAEVKYNAKLRKPLLPQSIPLLF
jgi:hypothetical protein